MACIVPVDSNGQCLEMRGKKMLGFQLEGCKMQTCEHSEVDYSGGVSLLPLPASNAQSSHIKKECESGASHGHPICTRESVLPSETNECLSVANNSGTTSVHQFFLPSDDETDITPSEFCAEFNGQTEESTPPLGLEHGMFHEARIPRTATARRKVGVQLCGSHHVFTVVPVGSGELRADNGEPQICTTTTEYGVDTNSKQMPSAKSQIFPACTHYSPNNTVKGSTVGRHVTYSPYHTITRGAQIPGAYNHYHTIAGLEPTSYQRSESGLRRVSTSRREYGVGGSSVPPSLFNVALLPGITASPSSSKISMGAAALPITSGLHRVRTLPCTPTRTLRAFREDAIQPSIEGSEDYLPSEHVTVQSINQMTVRSAGALSIDVGSTDGRNVKIHGAVECPEQLPLLPAVPG